MACRLSSSSFALGLVAVLAMSACAAASTSAPSKLTEAVGASREFQRSYDQALRDDPASFLTTVAAYYLAPGDALALARTNEGWVEADADQTPTLSFEAASEALTLTHMGEQHRFEAGAQLVLDERFTLSISAQELDWRVLVHDADAEQRADFPGIAWFPVDARFIVEADYQPRAAREPMLLQTSRGVQKTLYVAGEARFELAGASASLLVFAYEADPRPGEPMLIPFRDATSGKQSYAAGRYLEIEAPTGPTLVLDFNRATNPLCAYSEHYNCPMPPRFNRLEVAIEAGAMASHDPHS